MADHFWISLTAIALALMPASLFIVNGAVFRAPRSDSPHGERDAEIPGVSILIPARNEAGTIAGALEAATATTGVPFEIVVLDDDSADATADIVAEAAARDRRIRLERSRPLPAGWCGKQHACSQLAELARFNRLCFIDADVRLSPDAALRLSHHLDATGAGLVSAVPRQITGTLLEKLLIPLIHFFMLGYLPMPAMRQSRSPAYAAGCGQLFLADRASYRRAGGHAAIRSSLHDGVTLPRAFRRAGLLTDVCDGTPIASCRMYHSAGEVWRGLLKNAHEGIGSPRLIGLFTVLLLGGCVLPFLLPLFGTPWPMSLAAMGLAWFPRFFGVARFGDSLLGAILHPVSILIFLAIQWTSLVLRMTGRKPAAWKGRTYP